MNRKPKLRLAWVALTTAAAAVLLGCSSTAGSPGPATSAAPPAGAPTSAATPSGSPSADAPSLRTVPTYTPSAIAFDKTGQLFVADCFAGYVLRVRRDGRADVYAGTGVSSVMGSKPVDGTPREQVELDCPAALALDPSGRLLVIAHADNRILAFEKDGRVVTVAGLGPPGTLINDGDLGGDGGAATGATLQEPVAMTFDSAGSLYFSDRDNHAVRRIDTHGVITTVAGTGDPGNSGDGGPATRAKIERPQGLLVTADGTLYFSDGDNAYVRKVDPHGVITTIAGKGTRNPIDPGTLLLDAHGRLLVSDTSSIRRMTTSGRLTTIAGKPNPDAQGDEPCTGIGGPATHAVITPSSLAVGPHGDVFIATNTCGVLRLGSDGVLSQYVPAAG